MKVMIEKKTTLKTVESIENDPVMSINDATTIMSKTN